MSFFDFSNDFVYHAGKKKQEREMMTDYSFSASVKESSGPVSGALKGEVSEQNNVARTRQEHSGKPKEKSDSLMAFKALQNDYTHLPTRSPFANGPLTEVPPSALKIQGPDRHWPSYLRFDMDLFLQKLLRKDELTFAHS